jgi:DNA-binding transcriptional LysR family regulator|nr:LysR family transcriptional regulator [Kofleriaceae bacterium]
MAFTPLNSLNAYIAVARHRSYASAARELGVSTSALSQSVKQLEQRLGVPLLSRTSRSVAPTEAGQRLLENAGPGIDQALESLKTVGAARDEVSGRVKITVPGVSVGMVLERLVPRFIAEHPKVELDVRVDDGLVNMVKDGFDAGIRLVESIDRDMVHVRLSQACRIVVAGSPAYFKRRGTPEKPPDLLQHDCIGFRFSGTDAPWAWELERGKKTWRIPIRGPLITNNRQLSTAAAVAGVGLIYGLEPMIASEIERGRLRVVLAPYSPEVPGLFLYFPSRSQVSAAVKAFVAMARQLAAEDDG